MALEDPQSGRILLSGASGMLGSAIGAALRQQGADVLRLVRRPAADPNELRWNPAAGDFEARDFEIERLAQALRAKAGLAAAIHLSGASVVSRRWTAAYKREMTESRVAGTRVLAEALARLKSPPAVLIAASAVGFYGNRGDDILDESSGPGRGFFPGLCAAWEAATRPAENAGIRVVHLRFAMVVGRGGALARMAPIFRLGLGGPLGNGSQWMSWVSETDTVSAVLFVLANPNVSGPVNVTSPEPVTNAAFTRELGRALHRPALLPAPAFALRLAFGEMAEEALLASIRAIPKRLMQAGFVFTHPTLADALRAALA